MNKKIIFGLMAVIVLVFVIYLVSTSNAASDKNSVSVNSQSQQKIKFSDTKYWSHAYLISSDTLDDQTKKALSGFEVQKSALPNGDLKITLKALSPEYQDQSYTLKPDQKLYFIETSFGDDNPVNNGEYSLRDDTAVVVDSDGYIVK